MLVIVVSMFVDELCCTRRRRQIPAASFSIPLSCSGQSSLPSSLDDEPYRRLKRDEILAPINASS